MCLKFGHLDDVVFQKIKDKKFKYSPHSNSEAFHATEHDICA